MTASSRRAARPDRRSDLWDALGHRGWHLWDGFAAARRLAQAGSASLVVNGRDSDRGEAAARALEAAGPGVRAQFVAADVSSLPGAQALFERAAAEFGGLDVLVTSAGGDFVPRLFHDTPAEEIDAVLRHWLVSTITCCRLALPLMGEGGAIVTVCSDAAKVPTPGETVIGAAMAGIAMFSRTLAIRRSGGASGSTRIDRRSQGLALRRRTNEHLNSRSAGSLIVRQS